MKKYKVVKWLALCTAIIAVLCFFLPFAYLSGSGILLGIKIIFSSSTSGVIKLGIWLTRISFVISLGTVAVAIMPFVSKDVNGLNKQGKIHKLLFVSIGLSFLSAALNFISMLVGFCTKISETENRLYEAFYTYIGLILIFLLAVAVAILLIKLRNEIAGNKQKPKRTQAAVNSATAATARPTVISEKASASFSRNTSHLSENKSQINSNDIFITKREAEGLFAYIWVKQYNAMPFEQALDVIMDYLAENRYIVTPTGKKDAEGLFAYIWARQFNSLPFDQAIDKIMDYLVERNYVVIQKTEATAETEFSAPITTIIAHTNDNINDMIAEAKTCADVVEHATTVVASPTENIDHTDEKSEEQAATEPEKSPQNNVENIGDKKPKKLSYFKRVKQPISKEEDAKPLVKETTLYFCLSLVGFVGCGILGGLVPIVSVLFIILGVGAFLFAGYFGFMLYAMKRALRRFKNIHCDKCNTQLVNDENTTWEEVSRSWRLTDDQNSATGRIYVTVKITCVCPNCGTPKSFLENLCSGKITVTDYSINKSVVSTQQLVDDYFAGFIH